MAFDVWDSAEGSDNTLPNSFEVALTGSQYEKFLGDVESALRLGADGTHSPFSRSAFRAPIP